MRVEGCGLRVYAGRVRSVGRKVALSPAEDTTCARSRDYSAKMKRGFKTPP